MIRRTRLGVAIAALTCTALVATGCGGGDGGEDTSTEPKGGSLKGQVVEVMGIWTGDEQKKFQKVLDGFAKETGATVKYTAAGDNLPTLLNSRIAGKQPPDVATVGQPGLVTDLATRNALTPVNADTEKNVTDNYDAMFKTLGSHGGKLYGVNVKAANKSLMWYSTAAFETAGVEEPKTWDDFTKAVTTISDSGVSPLSVAGADGWTLTDWFENVYLRVAGPEKYDQLTKHEIPWTDQTVIDSLTVLKDLWSMPNAIQGGPKGAQQIKFTDSVKNVFAGEGKAAIVFEGDFVATNIASDTDKKVGDTAKFFAFPSIKDSPESVVTGGDTAVATKNTPGALALLQYLSTADAAKIWAEQGGYLSANKKLDSSVYPDETTRKIGEALVKAKQVRFDMSDLVPAKFGATVGAGMWKVLQDFLVKQDVNGTAKALEAAAKAAGSK